MYTNKRTPRTTPGRRPAYTPARSTPGRAATVSARRRLNFSPSFSKITPKLRIGFNPTSYATGFRRNVFDGWTGGSTTRLSKTLYNEELTLIPRKTGVEVNARERDVINCTGFTLRYCFTNNNSNKSAVVRMAVVSPIERNTITNVSFFRGYGDKRADDFSSNDDAAELLYSPINRDKYTVLWEKKVTLGPRFDDGATSVTYSRNNDNYHSGSTFVRLGRQLRYVGSAADDCTDKVFFVFWYDEPDGAGSATGSDLVICRRWFATHWKDP